LKINEEEEISPLIEQVIIENISSDTKTIILNNEENLSSKTVTTTPPLPTISIINESRSSPVFNLNSVYSQPNLFSTLNKQQSPTQFNQSEESLLYNKLILVSTWFMVYYLKKSLTFSRFYGSCWQNINFFFH
jgi:hypothetical protein